MSYEFTRFGDFMEEERILKEMAIAGYGDWKPSKEMIATKGASVVRTKWKLLDTFVTYSGLEVELRYLQDEYIVGRFVKTSTDDEIFEILLNMTLSEHKSIAKDFGITKRLMNVDGVRVKETSQGDGIALHTYMTIIKKQDIVILGDEIQFYGARKLWTRLSKRVDVRVDIIDLESEKVLGRDVILKHGTEDWEFDNRVWSYDYDKKHIRLILKEIK